MQHSNLTKRQVIAVFLALMTAMFVGSLDQTIVSRLYRQLRASWEVSTTCCGLAPPICSRAPS